MANTINANAIAKILRAEYERELTRSYKLLQFANKEFEWDVAQKWDTVRVPYVTLGWGWNTWTIDPTRDIPKTDITIWTHNMVIEQYQDIRVVISDKELSLLWKDMKTTQEIVRQLKDLAQRLLEDYFVSKLTWTTLATGNEITGASWWLNAWNVHAEIEKIAVQMDKQNVPEDERYVFVSPTNASIIRQSELFDNLESWYRKRSEGEIWKLAWLMAVKSNAISDNNVIGYHNKACNFVEKLNFIKIKEATDWNYYNILGWLFYDSALLWEGLKKVVKYTLWS